MSSHRLFSAVGVAKVLMSLTDIMLGLQDRLRTQFSCTSQYDYRDMSFLFKNYNCNNYVIKFAFSILIGSFHLIFFLLVVAHRSMSKVSLFH